MSDTLYKWFKSLLSVSCALLLSLAAIYGIIKCLSAVSDDYNDFDFLDVYARVGDRTSVAKLSNDVVIVSIDDCSRDKIAQVIDAVNFCSPAAIGLDVFFIYPSDDDNLINSIKSCDRIVLPLALGEECIKSYFYHEIDAELGVINVASSSVFDIIRNYIPVFRKDSIEYRSMPMVLIEKAGFSIPEREPVSRHIWYPAVEFDVIEADELVDEYGLPVLSCTGRIQNKIVLIGAMRDYGDLHRTPVDDEMPGMVLQGHIIDTLLHDRLIRETSVFWNILIAFIICLLFTRLHLFLKDRLDDIGEMLMHGLQLLLIYILLVIGVNLYLKHGLFIDFSITMMMLFLSFIVLSTINGMTYLFKKIFER